MTVSRRLFVVGSGVMGLAAPTLSGGVTPHAAAAVNSPASRLAPVTTTSALFDRSFASATPFSEVLAVVVTGTARELSVGRVEVSYDTRISSVTADHCTITGDKHFAQQTVTATPGVLTVDLPTDFVDADTRTELTVAVPLTRHALYPNDAVDHPHPTTIRLISRNDGTVRATATADAESETITGPVWGATLAAIWDTIDLNAPANQHSYSYPAFVRVTSVGPADIPPGTRINLRVDAALSRLRDVAAHQGDDPADAVEFTHTETTEGGARTITLTLANPIPAKQSLTITTRITRSRERLTSHDVAYARVWLEGADPGSPLQRITGSETAVAVTRSGVPRTAAAFTGTI